MFQNVVQFNLTEENKMARLNIWEDTPSGFTEIGFNEEHEDQYIGYCGEDSISDYFSICDEDGGKVFYYVDQIDDLIKALQKAKGLWGNN